MINALSDAFERVHQPSTRELALAYGKLWRFAQELRKTSRWADLYRASAFRQLTVAGQEIARSLGLVGP